MSTLVRFSCALAVICSARALDAQAARPGDWPSYGRDAGGSRFSPLTQIPRENVACLEVASIYHTKEGGLQPRRGAEPSLEATPLVVDGTMYISIPLGRVIALDPGSGRERWRFDSRVDPQGGCGDFTNRGVSTWLDPRTPRGPPCHRRIYVGTIDARIIALDAAAGCRTSSWPPSAPLVGAS